MCLYIHICNHLSASYHEKWSNLVKNKATFFPTPDSQNALKINGRVSLYTPEWWSFYESGKSWVSQVTSDLRVTLTPWYSRAWLLLGDLPRQLSRDKGVEPLFIHSREASKQKVSPDTKLIKNCLIDHLKDLRQVLKAISRWHQSFSALLEDTELGLRETVSCIINLHVVTLAFLHCGAWNPICKASC